MERTPAIRPGNSRSAHSARSGRIAVVRQTRFVFPNALM